jgi:hypothetical protein
MAARSWTKFLAQAALLGALAATGTLDAQEPAGSISIRLTDLYSKPIEGVVVTLRNRSTGAVARASAMKNGVYRFAGLEPGDYMLGALSPRLGFGELDDIEILAGGESRIQAAILFGHRAHEAPASIARRSESVSSPLTGSETAPAEAPVVHPQASTSEVASNLVSSPSLVPVGIFHAPGMSSMMGGACIARLAAQVGSVALQAVQVVPAPEIGRESMAASLSLRRNQSGKPRIASGRANSRVAAACCSVAIWQCNGIRRSVLSRSTASTLNDAVAVMPSPARYALRLQAPGSRYSCGGSRKTAPIFSPQPNAETD